jgi:ABC-type Fe3+-hydroxamate transport system substrate-binding protein
MKKITGLILMLCVMLAAAGCSGNNDKADESTSATTSVSEAKETSAIETTTQTEQTTEETTVEVTPSEAEASILKLDKKELYNFEWSEEYAIPLVATEYSAILLRSEDAKRYPELAAVLNEIADAQDGYMKDDFDMLTELAKEKIFANLHNGEIMLLHPTSKTNALILKDIIVELRARGYRFGTLDEL